MSGVFDAVIIGAGPAGMAAGAVMAERGARVLVLDEQAAPGGQIYRGIEAMPAARVAAMGADYAAGAALVARFRASGAEYRPGAMVWQVVPGEEGHEVWFSIAGKSRCVVGKSVLVAAGAMERPVPVPGWTLPGVMGAGAVQVLLKAGIGAERLVIAGAGPLVLLLAAQCLALGVRPLAVLDTTPAGNFAAALPLLPGAVRGRGLGYLWKGLLLQARLRFGGVRVVRVTDVVLEGAEAVRAVSFRAGGQVQRIEADIVALHEGVIPAQQMTRALGCAHKWDEGQRCFRPVLDGFGNTSVHGVLVAGDGGGIGGARAAAQAGVVAGAEMLRRAGRVDGVGRDAVAGPALRDLAAEVAVRPFLDRLFRPAGLPGDEVVVCRCEEVTAGDIRAAAAQGAQGPNQAKAFLRTGMGACQGRICGPMVSEIMAGARGVSMDEIGYYRIRAPLKPITVGELAAAGDDGDD